MKGDKGPDFDLSYVWQDLESKNKLFEPDAKGTVQTQSGKRLKRVCAMWLK